MHIECPHCRHPLEVVPEQELSDVTCPSCGSRISLTPEPTYVPEPSPHAVTDDTPRLVGRYELLERIGRGAFGTVWRALDTRLDRLVAVKIPRHDQFRDGTTRQFLREARAAAQLNHPGIVSVHEAGQSEGEVFIVSDYVDGPTLSESLKKKLPSPGEAAELCVALCSALQHAHQAGVIHRDLKPGNILIAEDGSPVITDFGLAKREAGEITVTIAGQILGTPAYMPPEQAAGLAHEADPRSDIYSLGIILYRLLTGVTPFQGKTELLIDQILHAEPASPRKLSPHISRDLAGICLKCIEKDPQRRYQTADELEADFRRYLRGEAVRARPTGFLIRSLRRSRRHPVTALLSLLLAVSLPIVGIGYLVMTDRQQQLADDRRGLVDEKEALSRRNTEIAKDVAEKKALAEQRARRVESLRLASAATSVRQENPVLAALLAIAASDTCIEANLPISPEVHQELLKSALELGGKPYALPDRRFFESRISNDDQWLVVLEDSPRFRKRARLISVEDPKVQHVLRHPDARVNTAEFVPKTNYLAVGSGAGIQLLTPARIPDPDEEPQEVHSVAIGVRRLQCSSDGEYLVAHGTDDRLRWWTIKNFLDGREPQLAAEDVPGFRLNQFEICEDNTRVIELWVASEELPGGGNRQIRLSVCRLLKTGVTVSSFSGGPVVRHTGSQRLIGVGPQRKQLLVRSTGEIAIAEGAGEEPFDELDEEIQWLRLRGNTLVAATFSGRLFTWDLFTKVPSDSRKELSPQGAAVHVMQLTADASRLVSAGSDGSLLVQHLWNEEEPDLRTTVFESGVYGLDLSPSSLVACSAEPACIRLWSLWPLSESPFQFRGHQATVQTVGFADTDGSLITSGFDPRAWQWSMLSDNAGARGKRITHERLPVTYVHVTEQDELITGGHTGIGYRRAVSDWSDSPDVFTEYSKDDRGRRCPEVHCSRDGRRAVCVSRDKITAYRIIAGDAEPEFSVPELLVDRLAPGYLKTDRDLEVIGHYGQGKLTFLFLNRDMELTDQVSQDLSVSAFVISGNGDYAFISGIAPGEKVSKLWVWDLRERQNAPQAWPRVIDSQRTSAHQCLAANNRGTLLAASTREGPVRLWNMTDGLPVTVRELRGHRREAGFAAFSEADRWLLTSDLEGTTLLHDLRSSDGDQGSALLALPLPGPESVVTAAAFSSDETRLAAGDTDGGVYLWDLRAERLADRLRRLCGRQLTAEECLRYQLSAEAGTPPQAAD